MYECLIELACSLMAFSNRAFAVVSPVRTTPVEAVWFAELRAQRRRRRRRRQ